MNEGGNFPLEFGVVNSSEPIPWRGFRAFDKVVFVVLPVMALAIAALPLLDPLLFRRIARLVGGRPLVAWLATGGAWIIAAGLLAVLAVYLLWRRHVLVSNRGLWSGNGCPACGEHELVRVSRHFSDRFYNLAAVPAYRYACRNCTWRGLRIARREHSLEHEAELEAALLRFDPHSPTATGDTMAARPQPAAYRDTGDANWEANATPAYANGTADESDEALEEMEWIWPRPTGTDQL